MFDLYYRKEIDGLRAIAILPVIWIHSGLPYVSGGYLGVDVFFVISGFLITSILLKECESGTFSLMKFYERRARRILPALLFVIVLSSLVVPLVTSHPKFIGDYGDSVLSTLFFVSNIYFWQTSGYFGSASELSPMLHTWSLAVEEQYYIFFPLLVMFLFTFGRKVVASALGFIFIVSLLIAQWGATNSPIANFYLLPSRAWELMAGALAAVFYSQLYILRQRRQLATFLSAFGIILIVVSYMVFTPSTLHPSSLTLAPILGVVLVLLFANRDNVVGKMLSVRFLSAVGVSSYSLYLWHQPILALMKRAFSNHLTPMQIFIAVALTFLFSYISWKYVENPFRDKRKFSQTKIFSLSLASVFIVALGGLLFKGNLYIQKSLFTEKMARYEQTLVAHKSHSKQVMFESHCKFWSNGFEQKFISRFEKCAKTHNKAIFILGGSHGMDLYNAIAMNASNPFIVSVSKAFCRAHKLVDEHKRQPSCQYTEFKQFADKYAKQIALVLYTQTPDRLFKVADFSKANGDDLSLTLLDEVVDYLTELKLNGANVMMIGMQPPLEKSPIDWNYQQPFDQQFDSIVSEHTMYLTKLVDQTFASKLNERGIPYFSKFDAFSLHLPYDLIIDGNITYSDKRHISDTGEKIFGERLIGFLTEKGYGQFQGEH